jgi:hypothetical protein
MSVSEQQNPANIPQQRSRPFRSSLLFSSALGVLGASVVKPESHQAHLTAHQA